MKKILRSSPVNKIKLQPGRLVEPSVDELYQLFQYRAYLRLKFMDDANNVYTLAAVLRETTNVSNFTVIAEHRGGMKSFRWEEMVNFRFLMAKTNFTRHQVELVDDEKHHNFPTAQLRSEYFAEKAKIALQRYKEVENRNGFVFTLDGRLRNCQALCHAGIPPQQVIVIEMKPIVALFQKLMAQYPDYAVNVIYAGEAFQDPRLGFQGFFINNLFQFCPFIERHNVVRRDTVAVYADFCGDVPQNLERTLQILPNLAVFGVTQSRRNTHGLMPQLDHFYLLRKFRPDRVRCMLYAKAENSRRVGYLWKRNCPMETEHVLKRICEDYTTPSGKRKYRVEWLDGEQTWEPETNLHEEQINNYNREASKIQRIY